jgi:hypothetical protein
MNGIGIEVSTALSRRISEEIRSLTPEPIGHINYEGIRYQALPLFGTIGQTWLLRPDGTLWRSDSELGLELEPLPTNLWNQALMAGSERYSWLGEVLPARPADAQDCDVCDGLGRSPFRYDLLCASCGGLGWRPASKR